MESTLVIKVKYGDTLRRFNARVAENGLLDLDKNALRAKILDLFAFPPDADLTLTYVDEDGDVITLVDDDDLRDVMKQRLKFLRLEVKLNNDNSGTFYAWSSGNSTPMRSPRAHDPLPKISTGLAEVLKSVPEPIQELLTKMSHDLASKATSSKAVKSNPVLNELVDCFSNAGQSFLNLVPRPQRGADPNAQIPVPGTASPSPAVPNVSGDGGKQDSLPNSASQSRPEESSANIPGKGAAASPTPGTSDGKGTQKQNDLPWIKKYSPIPFGASAGFGASASLGDFGASAGVGASAGFGTSSGVGVSPGFGAPSGNYRSSSSDVELPFGATPLANNASSPYPLKKIKGRGEGTSGGVFHKGVQCDGCGVHPITGPRFKSKVRHDYDLCSICFTEMGNEADYIKIERPISKHNSSNNWRTPPHHFGAYRINPSRFKLDSRFILDVNVTDGTSMAPSTPFTKIWRMRNSGSLTWPPGTQVVFIGGDRFGFTDLVNIEIPSNGVPVDGELDIAVDFLAPKLPGRYISYWRMASSSGIKFGQRIWVLIQVDASLKDTLPETFQGLNLNLPPESSQYPKILDTNTLPVVEPSNLASTGSEPLKPAVLEEPMNLESTFPLNDYLLLDTVVTSSPQPASSASYPIIDLPAAAPAPTSSVSYPIIDLPAAAPAPTSSGDDGANSPKEEALLKELEDMGFKQVNLNKEILRVNEYNLEQSVDDLCGVAEWDPILEELQEMGFHDKERNVELLKKNNGSIRRVVMDILTGEKE